MTTNQAPADDTVSGAAVTTGPPNYFPVEPATPRPRADGMDDQDVPTPRLTDDTTTSTDGTTAKASTDKPGRTVPVKPLATIGGGSLAALLPMVAQATSGRDLLILAGGTAAAGGLGVAGRAARKRRTNRRTGGAPARGWRRNRTAGQPTGLRMPGLGLGGGGSGKRALGLGGGGKTRAGAAGLGGPKPRSSKTGGLFKRKPATGPGGGPTSKANRRAAAPSGPASAGRTPKRATTGAKTPRSRVSRAASSAWRGTGQALRATGRGLGRATSATTRAARRAAMAPFWATGQGVAAARKSRNPVDAVRRARKRAMKHRSQSGRGRHPFVGWGAALAGVGAYGATGLWRVLARIWTWNPPGMYDANGEPPPRVIGDTVRPDPDAATQTTASTAGPAQAPIVVAPAPVQPIGVRTAHNSRPGGTTMSDSALILHAQAMKNEAERRANVGARPGILEVVDDSKRFGVAVKLVEESLAAEVRAVQRFPFHPAILAAYASALQALESAAGVMTQCAAAIEDVHRDELEKLRNPGHPNAQMWDQSANNGARGGA
ncbi:hypothetical protein AB0F93_03575 [Micromonospora tulbaghiae]|uniref:hypothetical protein n=1 Tax=Micromonospora tulbaghiae TaxID=479978 RepID=UPI003322F811